MMMLDFFCLANVMRTKPLTPEGKKNMTMVVWQWEVSVTSYGIWYLGLGFNCIYIFTIIYIFMFNIHMHSVYINLYSIYMVVLICYINKLNE